MWNRSACFSFFPANLGLINHYTLSQSSQEFMVFASVERCFVLCMQDFISLLWLKKYIYIFFSSDFVEKVIFKNFWRFFWYLDFVVWLFRTFLRFLWFFFLDFLDFFGWIFKSFELFWDLFGLVWIIFKVPEGTTKSYQCFYWTPKKAQTA